MNRENLFKSIRQGDVVLWAGAGFSKYAGYPMGGDFVQKLHASLSQEEQAQLDPNKPLPDYADSYLTLRDGNRQHLITVLRQEFLKAPTSTAVHDLLASIPFIKTVVTTNYDELFELAYKGRLHKITSAADLAYGDNKSIDFYKIHGDLNKPDDLIISNKDFRSYYNRTGDEVWNAIRHLFATRTFLFAGYNMADPNVLSLFELINNALGKHKKLTYLVAPDLKELRIRELNRMGVQYINSTGEDLLRDFQSDNRSKLILELARGEVASDPTKEYLSRLGLDLNLSGRGDTKWEPTIKKSEGLTTSSLKFTVAGQSPVQSELYKLIEGDSFSPVRLKKSDLVFSNA